MKLCYIGAIYFMLGNLDPAVRSQLDTINLVALFNSDLLQTYSFDCILQPFIVDLKALASVSAHVHIHYVF